MFEVEPLINVLREAQAIYGLQLNEDLDWATNWLRNRGEDALANRIVAARALAANPALATRYRVARAINNAIVADDGTGYPDQLDKTWMLQLAEMAPQIGLDENSDWPGIMARFNQTQIGMYGGYSPADPHQMVAKFLEWNALDPTGALRLRYINDARTLALQRKDDAFQAQMAAHGDGGFFGIGTDGVIAALSAISFGIAGALAAAVAAEEIAAGAVLADASATVAAETAAELATQAALDVGAGVGSQVAAETAMQIAAETAQTAAAASEAAQVASAQALDAASELQTLQTQADTLFQQAYEAQAQQVFDNQVMQSAADQVAQETADQVAQNTWNDFAPEVQQNTWNDFAPEVQQNTWNDFLPDARPSPDLLDKITEKIYTEAAKRGQSWLSNQAIKAGMTAITGAGAGVTAISRPGVVAARAVAAAPRPVVPQVSRDLIGQWPRAPQGTDTAPIDAGAQIAHPAPIGLIAALSLAYTLFGN